VAAGDIGMRIASQELTEQYSAALREYCANGGEAALSWAFHLGHRAASEDLGVLEMTAIHHKGLEEALEMLPVGATTRFALRASEFLAEALAPFEQRHRRFQEGHSTLCDLNQGLEQWLNATQHKLEAAQEKLVEQERAEKRKNALICVISHEMHGSLGVLKSVLGELSAHGERLLDVILRNSEQVIRLVGDPPDVETIESGALALSETAASSGSGSS
jgi:signal transduction histidine kinase